MSGSEKKVKEGYKISEVSKMLDLPASVLRYWETEFEQLRPPTSKGGQRRYTDKDIEQLQIIRHLLYDKKYTISGARDALSQQASASSLVAVSKNEAQGALAKIKTDLKAVLELLQKK